MLLAVVVSTLRHSLHPLFLLIPEQEDEVIETVREDLFKYLGIMQARRIAQNTATIQKYLLKTTDSKNKIEAINTYAITVLTLTFGGISWT